MPGKRGASLLEVMLVIELYTLERMWTDLTDAELFWEPVPNAWGVRRRAECRTPTPFGDGEWVVDFDADLDAASDEGRAIVPMTTIGWLMWHIGSTPGTRRGARLPRRHRRLRERLVVAVPERTSGVHERGRSRWHDA